MAEIRNCVTAVTTPDGTTREVCTPCESAEMHDNCRCEGCRPIQVSCSIENAVCLPILADELYDSISAQKEDIGSLTNLTFNLDTINPNYVNGQLVCVRSIGITYDFIGLAAAVPVNSEIVISGQTFTLSPTSLYDASTVVGAPVYLFDELNGTITLQPPCCCEHPIRPGTKLRTIERNRAFQVANLTIVASGLIGGTGFTATAATAALFTPGSTLIPLSALGIPNMTFTGKICWPNDKNRMTLNENYIGSLGVDCIIPTSNYIAGAPGSFTANVDFSFAANRVLYASNRGAIAVFTTPNAPLTKSGEVIGNCLG